MKCPICKKDALFVGVHDDEGNYHGLVGCDYESDPWSGLSYALHHEGWGECPLCTDGEYGPMGGMLFDTAEEAISTITPQNEPRMINADKLAKRIAGHSNYHGDAILAAIYCAAEGKENDNPIRPIEAQQNEPLTVEQLREMDGEPVWVDFTGSAIKREPGWFILKNAQDEEVYLVGKTSVYKGYEYYGKAWLAYRHPPERQEDA